MFRSHSRAELSAWVRRLRYFRFHRALGGHANDGDGLVVSLRHDGDADAKDLCAMLTGTAWIEPGYVTLDGVRVFVWRSERALVLTLSGADGNAYEVTEADVANAVTLEARIARVAERVIAPPVNDQHWVTRETYPELWANE